MARPKRVFSEDEVSLIEGFALDNSKSETIANALDIPVNTLKRRFGRLMQQKRAEGKLFLKHLQQEIAKTNSQMAIWLGKQDLDQEDKQTLKTVVTGPEMTETEQEASKEAAKIYKLRMAQGQVG